MDFYTDASANDKTKDIFGVWGFLAIDEFNFKTIKLGIFDNLDNNATEILAVVEVFEFVLALPIKPKFITIHTDCDKNYRALTGWVEELAARDWDLPRKGNGKRQSRKRNIGGLFEQGRDEPRKVANKDLWALFYAKKLVLESMAVEIKVNKVEAHSGDKFNDLIDGRVRSLMRKERNLRLNRLKLKKTA